MNKFIITDNGSVGLNTEDETVFSLNSQREAISRIYLAEEPMTIVVKRGDKEYELNAKKDDLIISFYEQDFDMPVIIVKSKDWTKNLKNYEKNMQKRKEEWAFNKMSGAPCDECKTCEASC